MSLPLTLQVPNSDEEILLNDKGTFRVRRHATPLDDPNLSLRILAEIDSYPEQFLTEAFASLALSLKEKVERLRYEEGSLDLETGRTPTAGKARWLGEGTKEVCRKLVADFIATSSTLIPFVVSEATTKKQTLSGIELPTLTPEYQKLFGEGRWFELVCFSLVKQALSRAAIPSGRYVIRHDVEVLGRSGIWHEIDTLLLTRDVSICVEAKSGRWKRADVLKLLAQREDTACDRAVFLALDPPGEDFAPLMRTHPLEVRSVAGVGYKSFVEGLSERLRPSQVNP